MSAEKMVNLISEEIQKFETEHQVKMSETLICHWRQVQKNLLAKSKKSDCSILEKVQSLARERMTLLDRKKKDFDGQSIAKKLLDQIKTVFGQIKDLQKKLKDQGQDFELTDLLNPDHDLYYANITKELHKPAIQVQWQGIDMWLRRIRAVEEVELSQRELNHFLSTEKKQVGELEREMEGASQQDKAILSQLCKLLWHRFEGSAHPAILNEDQLLTELTEEISDQELTDSLDSEEEI